MADDALFNIRIQVAYCSLSNMGPVSRCIFVQKQAYMVQLLSEFLFNFKEQFIFEMSQHSRPPVIVALYGI